MTGLGFVGLGGLGRALLAEVTKLSPQLEVAAVQDVRLELAQVVAHEYAVPWAGARFEDLLEVPGVDAVVICTPNALHTPQAQAALRSGKDVLVQKPLALSLADSHATIDLAAEQRRLLFVDYSYRFLDTVDVLRTTLRQLGPIHSAQAVFHNIYGPGAEKTWFFDPALSGGGALTDLGVHLLDLGTWLLAPRETRLLAAELERNAAVESTARLTVALDGVEFQVDVSWNADRPRTEIFFEIQTTNGALVRWENVEGSFFRFRTLRDGAILLERETTLRADTWRAFRQALSTRRAPPIDARVYALLDQAYGRAA